MIENALRNGATPAVEIMRMAKEQGVSLKTLNRVKSELGVASHKRGDQWFWDMPVDVVYAECREDSQDGQDGHAPAMTALAV